MKSLVIAIDFDLTWTADPDLWRAFAGCASRCGHKCIIATGRRGWSDDMADVKGMEVVYCGHILKEQACRKAGWDVDIWIDDMPGMIQDCRIIGGNPEDA